MLEMLDKIDEGIISIESGSDDVLKGRIRTPHGFKPKRFIYGAWRELVRVRSIRQWSDFVRGR